MQYQQYVAAENNLW